MVGWGSVVVGVREWWQSGKFEVWYMQTCKLDSWLNLKEDSFDQDYLKTVIS